MIARPPELELPVPPPARRFPKASMPHASHGCPTVGPQTVEAAKKRMEKERQRALRRRDADKVTVFAAETAQEQLALPMCPEPCKANAPFNASYARGSLWPNVNVCCMFRERRLTSEVIC